MRLMLPLLVLAFSASQAASGEDGSIVVTHVARTVFDNKDCERTKSCDLRQVWYEVMDAHKEDNEVSRGTGLRAGYITDSIEFLERYIFVQQIRGCIYSSYKNALGITIGFRTIKIYGKDVLFRFPTWVIDSIDTDPAFGTLEGAPNRHYDYHWGTRSDWQYYGLERPTEPELFVRDFPSFSGLVGKMAENVSIEFRTCLYKTEEVPADVTPEKFGEATPLSCHKWGSSYVYDHNAEKFTSPSGISPVCSMLEEQ